jgi:cytosine/adenosine deaminase-related metal-dependent hydrolase
MDRDRTLINDGAIVTKGDRILDVGKSTELDHRYDALKTINGTDKLVLPGLINAHLHFFHHMHKNLSPENLGLIRFANWHNRHIGPLLTAEDEIIGGLALLIETLKSGTTTYVEDGCFFPENALEGVVKLGMRGSMGRRVFDQAVRGYSKMVQSTDDCLRLNEEFINRYKNGLGNGRIKPHLSVMGMGRCTDRLLVESKRIADRYNVSMHLHTAASIEVVMDSIAQTGHRPVEHLDHLGVLGHNVVLSHMVHVNAKEIQMIKQYESHIVHCPTIALKLVLGLSSFGRIPEMLNAGVNVCLGSDVSDGGSYHDMIRITYLVAVLFKDYRFDPGVIPAETAIEMATINGARALGLEDEIGSLEKGKKADIILISMEGPEWIPRYNPIQNLVYSSSGSSVKTAIIDGKIVMEDREIKTVDEAKILSSCQALSRRILQQNGINPINTFWRVV